MSKRLWFVTAALLAAALTAGCGRELSVTSTPRPVKAQAVEGYSGRGQIRYSASIEPYEQVTLAFKVGGYIVAVRQVQGADGRMRNLQEGDSVGKGTALARVRETDYVANLERAKSALAEAQAGLKKATRDYERARKLFEDKSLTLPELDAATAAFEASQAQLDGARAQQEQAEIALRDCALVSPLDGVVLKRTIEVGALVAAGSPGFVVADTSLVKAVFGVPDSIMRRARPGMSLAVAMESHGGGDFRGRITAIGPSADPASRVFDVQLTIPNPRNLLKPGMIVTVAVPEEPTGRRREKDIPVVPLSAVVKTPKSPQGFAVFVIEEQGGRQVARIRPVTLGEVYGNRIAVNEGVKLGESVIVAGPALLADGEVVRVIR